jgi:hypothetical protein
MAANIAGRLPSTLAGMAAGVIDRDRARAISNATLHLPDDLAAEADKILAEAAPQIRLADLQQKAARLEARLDPDGVQKRKDEARAPSPRQARPRLETPAARVRRHALDHPLRPHLHHPPHPVQRLTQKQALTCVTPAAHETKRMVRRFP